MLNQARFILGSGSPRRREIIGQLGIDYTIIKPEIDEMRQAHEAPLAYVERLSQEKAQAVLQKVQEPITVLSADTIVILAADTIGIAEDGEILGKPTDAEDARAMLKRLRNKPHQVCTAFTVQQTGDTPRQHTEIVCTTVYMRDYTDAEIETYIATKDPFDKAGSYAIQHEGFHPVERIEGSYSNVVGLPTDELKIVLQEFGIL